jgi:hypothetical protein
MKLLGSPNRRQSSSGCQAHAARSVMPHRRLMPSSTYITQEATLRRLAVHDGSDSATVNPHRASERAGAANRGDYFSPIHFVQPPHSSGGPVAYLGLTHEDLLFMGCAGTPCDVKRAGSDVRCSVGEQSRRVAKAMTGVRRRCPQDTTRNPVLPTVPLACVCIPARATADLPWAEAQRGRYHRRNFSSRCSASRQWLALELR